jgi:hypothetical protein
MARLGAVPVIAQQLHLPTFALYFTKDWKNVLELAMLVAPTDKRAAVARYASPAIVGTLGVSAAMNAFVSASYAVGLMVWPAIGLGTAIPALVYAFTRMSATLWLSEKR